ncbi:MAG: ribosome-associated translation inhibitor RaiA [Clostridiales bacterium]|nr:ribosome-associated translation inhibitor RaiA [Clostridiales bacterium]
MRIVISGKNVDLTDALREQITKKVSKLERYFDDNTEAQVTMSVEKHRHIMEVTIPFDGVVLRAEDYTDDMYKTLDLILEKLESQIHKYRTKLDKRMKSGAFKYDAPIFTEPYEQEEEDYPRIVRTKRFAVKPMLAEEAVLQMELLGHNFFVFTDAESNEVSVVYKRNDGNYGLIEPEYL